MDIEKMKEQLTKELREALVREYEGKPNTEHNRAAVKRQAEQILEAYHAEMGAPVNYDVVIKLED